MIGEGYRRGKDHAHAKLTEDQVKRVREGYVSNSHSRGYSAFARRYGVDQSTIRDAVQGITWAHVQGTGE
jgi:hypothetical protein